MTQLIQVQPTIRDGRAVAREEKIESLGISVENVNIADVYKIDADLENLEEIAKIFSNPVTDETKFEYSLLSDKSDWVIETGFKPGVKDNLGDVARELPEKGPGMIIFENGVNYFR